MKTKTEHREMVRLVEKEVQDIRYLQRVTEAEDLACKSSKLERLQAAFTVLLGPDNSVRYRDDNREPRAIWRRCEFVLGDEHVLMLINHPEYGSGYLSIWEITCPWVNTAADLLRIHDSVTEWEDREQRPGLLRRVLNWLRS